jgi:hypothetical protein
VTAAGARPPGRHTIKRPACRHPLKFRIDKKGEFLHTGLVKSESEILLVFLLTVTMPLGPIAMAAIWNRHTQEAKMDRKIAQLEYEIEQARKRAEATTNEIPEIFKNPFWRDVYERHKPDYTEADSDTHRLGVDLIGVRNQRGIVGLVAVYDSTGRGIAAFTGRSSGPTDTFHRIKAWLDYWFGLFEMERDDY